MSQVQLSIAAEASAKSPTGLGKRADNLTLSLMIQVEDGKKSKEIKGTRIYTDDHFNGERRICMGKIAKSQLTTSFIHNSWCCIVWREGIDARC